MPKKHVISRAEYEAVVEAKKRTQNKYVARKLRVIQLRYEGKSNSEIAETVELTMDRVCRLIGEFKRIGVTEYAKLNYSGGHHRTLSEQEEGEILATFRQKAEAGQMITAWEIKAAFDARIGRDTGRGYIYMLLARHNWRKVMPRPRHPKKADEETIAASKKLTLP